MASPTTTAGLGVIGYLLESGQIVVLYGIDYLCLCDSKTLANNLRVFSRLFLGLSLGLAFGYHRFGDRQVLHNAWVAERLRRRYPDSKQLNETDLWRLKGVRAPHEFYRWQ